MPQNMTVAKLIMHNIDNIIGLVEPLEEKRHVIVIMGFLYFRKSRQSILKSLCTQYIFIKVHPLPLRTTITQKKGGQNYEVIHITHFHQGRMCACERKRVRENN